MISASKAGYALDASALLALVFNEPGQEKVSAVIDRAYIHSVNVAEVVAKLIREGVPRAEAEQTIEELKLDIDEELPARQAALSRCPRISSHSEWGVRYSSSARAFRGERG